MKKIILLVTFLHVFNFINAQEENPITTAVAFLLVAADARAAGMGDNGVASSADSYSQQWNPSKYAFATDQQGLSVSYTPYLTDLANDISLAQLTYYNKYSEKSAFAASFRYFGQGDIELRETSEPNDFLIVSPNEFAFDLSYSLKLSETFSMAVGGRFINSNLKVATANNDSSSSSSFAVDVAGFYQSEEIAYSDFNGRWRAGFNFQNMGPKMSYDNDDINLNFLPANMKLGGGFDFILDEYNKIAVNLELNKLMVPTPQVYYNDGYQGTDMNGDGVIDKTDNDLARDEYASIGWFGGMFQSFTDAPGGFSEELKEITYSLGSEYVYQDSFSFRAGYFHESPDKGAREFFSLGAGFKYSSVKIDVSYLFSASKVPNPLENTLRFSLSFNFGESYENY